MDRRHFIGFADGDGDARMSLRYCWNMEPTLMSMINMDPRATSFSKQRRIRVYRFLVVGTWRRIKARNKQGYTPLHRACEYGKEAIVSILLQKDANGNAQNEDK
jgi:hypothetical protein